LKSLTKKPVSHRRGLLVNQVGMVMVINGCFLRHPLKIRS
jgi:hypothetical protein